jgi:hypothetical protein
MKKLAVVLIHGMGSQTSAFAAPAIAELSQRITDLGHNPDEVAWQSIYWANILQTRQEQFLDDTLAVNDLDYLGLRKFVVKSLGDAAAYQYTTGPSATYATIHDRVRGLVHQLYENQLASQPVPLVVLAHSLGSHIMSSYIWDTQHQLATGADPASTGFEKMEWLAGMVTFGSNIPLFTFAKDPVVAIRFPGNELPMDVAAKARWINYYDKDDVLAYPLRQVSPSYGAVVDEDRQINVGGFGASATPLSHGAYWTDNDFTKPVAAFLTTFL